MSDREIAELLLRRDEACMDALLLRYGGLLRYVIAPILNNPQDTEDCLSEVSLRIWENAQRFVPERGSLKAWLTAIARNTALNYARSIRCHGNIEEITEDMPSAEPAPEEMIIQKERKAAVERAVSRLSAADRVLFYRKYYYLQSTAQIASEMGMTERAVEGKLYRLRKKLRGMLSIMTDDV